MNNNLLSSQAQPNLPLIFAISLVVALCGLLFGYDTGVISGALLFLQKDFNLSNEVSGFLVSIVPLGALVAALVSGRLTDLLGRRVMLLLDASAFILGTLLSSLAHSIEVLMVGRLIIGMAVGVASYISPLYISEIAPARFRGMLVTLHQVLMSFGFLSAYLINYYFASKGDWQWMFGTGAIPAMILLIGALFLPESPRWLMARGQKNKALAILDRINGPNSPESEEMLKAFSQPASSSNQQEWRKLFSAAIRPTLFMALGLVIFQQVVGINAILYYAPHIFLLAGFQDSESAILASVGLARIFHEGLKNFSQDANNVSND